MTSQTTGDKAPPPYLIQTNPQPAGDVKVYHLHTPFNPGESTIKDQGYQVQTSNLNSNEARPKYTSYDTELGRTPGMTTCTSCQTQVMSNVTYKVGTYAILMCILFILCGLILGCCLIPFFVKFFKDVYHTCPRCNRVLHVEKKKCC
ncbi:lipopolysaccharide-induced tumor necrosis factor-alpha factor homolog-like [Conger conger]|uniref:lipopolysaccharide-induced tumor necrosis factor-alpha factor homolog-like n=1 Tax=Conger conger TaxID=82655 RepID=UPI002A5988CF|nr:lipopolysaccharide-induced tumor necrosis factor-alpha factor homolog-like [Conger conger]